VGKKKLVEWLLARVSQLLEREERGRGGGGEEGESLGKES
jgi:hypothetical protein